MLLFKEYFFKAVFFLISHLDSSKRSKVLTLNGFISLNSCFNRKFIEDVYQFFVEFSSCFI